MIINTGIRSRNTAQEYGPGNEASLQAVIIRVWQIAKGPLLVSFVHPKNIIVTPFATQHPLVSIYPFKNTIFTHTNTLLYLSIHPSLFL